MELNFITTTADVVHNGMQTILGTIRTAVSNDLILLLGAVGLSWLLINRMEKGLLSKAWGIGILSLLFFIMLKYV